MALWALEVLQIALLLSLFATSHLLNSPFGRIGELEHHSLPTNALPAGGLGTGQTRLSVLATATPTATGPCQLPQPLPLTNKGTLERLGTHEYRNVDPFSSFVGIEETGLLERSYVDYFEGSESVIVKGRLRANVHFWESIGASHFVLSVIRDIIIRVILLRQFFFRIISLLCIMPISFEALSLNFVRSVVRQ